MAKQPKLTWNTPRWSYVPQLWGLYRHIFNGRSLVRIALATLVVSLAIVAVCRWAFPLLVLPNLWPLLLTLPAMLLLLAWQFSLLTLARPAVTVRPDRIVWSHGQSALRIDAAEVTATRLTFHEEHRIRLRICYRRKSQPRSRVFGVPPTVDFDRLCDLLPRRPIIRDARRRAAAAAVKP